MTKGSMTFILFEVGFSHK